MNEGQSEYMDKLTLETIVDDILLTTNELGGEDGMKIIEERYESSPELLSEAKVRVAKMVIEAPEAAPEAVVEA